MKNVIVTGGLGFIGSNLVQKLAKRYFVIILDKVTYSANLNNLKNIKKNKYKFFKCDINNKKKILSILKYYKPKAIFNLAAETHVDRSIEGPEEFMKSNIMGTFNLLEAFRDHYKQNNKIKFIHISTDEVYGDIKKKKFSKETDPYRPSSPYAASKASSDHIIYSYYKTFNLPLITTNCSNNYGPRQFPEKLIPKLIIKILNNENLPIYGDGKNEREWIHVDDHCDALIKIFQNGKVGENYNIGSGEILNNLQLSKIILKKMKKYFLVKSKINFIKDRPGHDKRYALNSKKIKKHLNWKKKFNINNGILNTIEWYIKNKEWIKKLNKKNYEKRIGL